MALFALTHFVVRDNESFIAVRELSFLMVGVWVEGFLRQMEELTYPIHYIQ